LEPFFCWLCFLKLARFSERCHLKHGTTESGDTLHVLEFKRKLVLYVREK
jgi:hypothetical protein